MTRARRPGGLPAGSHTRWREPRRGMKLARRARIKHAAESGDDVRLWRCPQSARLAESHAGPIAACESRFSLSRRAARLCNAARTPSSTAYLYFTGRSHHSPPLYVLAAADPFTPPLLSQCPKPSSKSRPELSDMPFFRPLVSLFSSRSAPS